jgi:hypothetical protein
MRNYLNIKEFNIEQISRLIGYPKEVIKSKENNWR